MFGFFSTKTEKPKKGEKKKKPVKTILNTTLEEDDEDMVGEVDENERWAHEGWSSHNLRDGDPAAYVCSTMESDTFPDPPLAEGWKYSGAWYSIIHRTLCLQSINLIDFI